MTGADLLGGIGAVAVVGTLLAAGAGHLRRPATLPRALALHGVLPAPWLVAALVTVSECLLGMAGVVALAGAGGPLRAVLLGGAALLALLAGYGRHVAGRRGGPCGCSRAELPMSGWVVTRALGLAALALAGAALADPATPLGPPGADRAVTLLAAAAVGVLLWQLPAAMNDPRTSTGIGVR